jgi:hypothetical protein
MFNSKPQIFPKDFLVSDCNGNMNLTTHREDLDMVFNQESPYKYPPLIICADTKRINQSKDIYRNYLDIIIDDCGNRYNLRNLQNSAGLLQAGYSRNIDLDSQMKNINFYKDKCFYNNWKNKLDGEKCNGVTKNVKILDPDYTAVGQHNDECIGNCDIKMACKDTPPTDINCETDVKKRYDFKYNLLQGKSCIEPCDRVSFRHAPAPETQNLEKYPNSDRNTKLLNTINAGVKHDYYQFFDSTKCQIFPQERLFNNVTKRSMLPTTQFRGDISPKYLS